MSPESSQNSNKVVVTTVENRPESIPKIFIDMLSGPIVTNECVTKCQ